MPIIEDEPLVESETDIEKPRPCRRAFERAQGLGHATGLRLLWELGLLQLLHVACQASGQGKTVL